MTYLGKDSSEISQHTLVIYRMLRRLGVLSGDSLTVLSYPQALLAVHPCPGLVARGASLQQECVTSSMCSLAHGHVRAETLRALVCSCQLFPFLLL